MAPRLFKLIAGAVIIAAPAVLALPPRFDHVVVVIEENHSQSNIIGNATAPYINSLATTGASFSNMHALIHPSQPNYLQFFSGSTQGVIDDTVPLNPQGKPTTESPFLTPNLGAAARAAGFTFAGYSQGQPAIGAQDAVVDAYRRKHNPWSNWQDSAWVDDAAPPAIRLANTLPKSTNLPFTSFPSDYAKLPTVSFVVPDQNNDMHDGTIAQADTWLKANLDPYVQWAKTHNSLLIVTWDEDDFSTGPNNQIPTILAGARVKAGAVVPQTYTLHNVLRTVEDVYGLAHSGSAAQVRPIVGPFTTDPTVNRVTFRQGVGGYTGARDTQVREAAATTAYAAQKTLAVDGDDVDATAGNQRAQSLLRFDNILSSSGGTIPADATILSAKLTLFGTNATGNPIEVHRMIAGWSDTATWNSLSAGVIADGTEAAVASDFTAAPPLVNKTYHFDVTDAVQAWVDGASPNNGFALLPTGADGFIFASAEAATVAQRPQLDVSYALYPRFSASGGSWNTAANWANGTPNTAGAVARFLNKAAASTVTLDGAKSVGMLLLDSPNPYTINPGTGGGGVTFLNNGNTASLQAKRGTHTLNVPLTFADPGSIEVATGARINATAGVTVAAEHILAKRDAGIFQVTGGVALGAGAIADVQAGELRVDRVTGSGALAVRSDAAARLTASSGNASVVTALTLDGTPGAWTGTLDIGRSALVVNYTGASPLPAALDQVRFAHAHHWAGAGITSSTAAATEATTAVAIAEASALLALTGTQTAQFMGQTVDATSLVIRQTRLGDANMDGAVDFNDLVRVAQNYNVTDGARQWLTGDFNFDGKTDFNDLVALAQNYNTALVAALPGATAGFEADLAAAFAAVPEPAACLLPALLARHLGRRRVRAVT